MSGHLKTHLKHLPMIGIIDTSVQVCYTVICLISKIQFVRMIHQSCSENAAKKMEKNNQLFAND